MNQNVVLKRIRALRSQLSFMYDYIMVCKEKERLLQLFGYRVYFMTGTEMLSLCDFQDVNEYHKVFNKQIKTNTLLPWLEKIVSTLYNHITHDCLVGLLCILE